MGSITSSVLLLNPVQVVTFNGGYTVPPVQIRIGMFYEKTADEAVPLEVYAATVAAAAVSAGLSPGAGLGSVATTSLLTSPTLLSVMNSANALLGGRDSLVLVYNMYVADDCLATPGLAQQSWLTIGQNQTMVRPG